MIRVPSSLPICLIVVFGLLVAGVAILLILDLNLSIDDPAPDLAWSGSAEVGSSGDAASAAAISRDEEEIAPPPLIGSGESHHQWVTEKEAVPASVLFSSIRGRVVEENGEALEKVRIYAESAFPDLMQIILPISEFSDSVLSDSSGCFDIPVPGEGAYTLQLEREGFAPAFVELALPNDDLEIVMRKGSELSGLVLDGETETPLKDATVFARNSMLISSASTDEEGQFLLKDLPSGLINLEVFCPGYDVGRIGSLFLQEEEQNFVTVLLKEGVPLIGLLSDRISGQPIPGASVVYSIGRKQKGEIMEICREETATDAQGLFRFEKVSRKGYRLQLTAEGYTTRILSPFNRIESTDTPKRIYLDKEGAITGTVYDPHQNPLPNAEIKVFQKDLWERMEKTTRTGPSGLFLLEPLGAGDISVFASHPSYSPIVMDNLSLPPGQTLGDIRIYLKEPSSIMGIVNGPDKKPLKGARVVLDGVRPGLVKNFQILPITLTDSDGSFAFDRLAEGEYRISANKESLRSTTNVIFLQTGEQLEFTLELEDGLTVSGLVCDNLGNPIDDVLVTGFAVEPGHKDKARRNTKRQREKLKKAPGKDDLSRSRRPYSSEWDIVGRKQLTQFRGSCRTGEDGRFTLIGLHIDDLLHLRFMKHGFTSRQLRDILPATSDLYIELTPKCALEGRVIDASTLEPVSAFSVELVKPQPASTGSKKNQKSLTPRSAKSERFFRTEDGSFRMESVQPGRYDIRVISKGYQKTDPLRMVISPDYPVSYLEFQLKRSGRLKGKVQGANKKPIRGLSVYIKPYASTIGGPQVSGSGNKKKTKDKKGAKSTKRKKPIKGLMQTRTDHNGKFLFTGLEPGSFEVLLGNPQKPIAESKKVAVREGESVASAFILYDLGSIELSIQNDTGHPKKSTVSLTGGPGQIALKETTGKWGTVELSNIIPGKYKLRVECAGFKTLSSKININKGKNDSLKFYLLTKNNK